MQLGALLEATYRAIHADIVDGVATGGDATHIIDTALTGKYQANKFKNWVAFLSRTTDGLSPQGKYGVISAYTNDGTATIPTVTDVVGAGDEYSFCKQDIPLYTLIKRCNDSLRSLGRIPLIDASLTVVSGTIRYNLPAAIKGRKPALVFFRDAATFEVADAPNYYVEPAASGGTAVLVFKATTLRHNGWKIIIHYEGLHEPLTAYNSPVNESIHDELAIALCVEKVMQWKLYPRQRKVDKENWSLAKQSLEEAKRNYPVELPVREQQRVPIDLFNL